MNIIYSGIDLHNNFLLIGLNKKTDPEDKIETYKLENEPQKIRKFFKPLRDCVKVCYEAGPCGYKLYRQLTDMGIYCEVIAPTLIPKSRTDKIKTDKRDAKRLTKLFRQNALTKIRVPDKTEESERAIIRVREQYSEKIRRVKHQIGKFLVYRGIKYDAGIKWTQRYMKWLNKVVLGMNELDNIILINYINELIYLEELRTDMDKKIEELSELPKYKDKVKKLKSFRGIKTYTSMALLTTVIDFKRFPTAGHFMSYIGLTPSEYSSGGKIVKGKITKNGNTLLRKLLIESSKHYRHPARVSKQLQQRWRDISSEDRIRANRSLKRLHRKYYKLLYTKNANKAAVAVARELCGFIWAAMNNIAVDRNLIKN